MSNCPDDPPGPGEAETRIEVMELAQLDHLMTDSARGLVLLRHLNKLRYELPYATELVLTVRWRSGG